ncbi:DUF1801 domain-containing protein [Phytoactinopolyspora mesophila]|uniref:DUF1801 domain-containing protein n=1 Tax=Phytoactinopolyspora mesophila TaxID=2650750 RepID=A0A7K3M9K1_9ACTN|nr:DUF1801 domain-containing protein [Phytoactinopolyspora mesophila]NDL59946.1 DUF1801 domain-containing protein [Phytoactinopolyspora mesophila]
MSAGNEISGPCRPEVATAYGQLAAPVRDALLSVRELIFTTVMELPATGGVREYLAWGQPAYRPLRDGVGTAIRLGEHGPGVPALLVHCRTSLIQEFRSFAARMDFRGRRAVLLDPGGPLPLAELRIMIELAFSYHERRGGMVHAGATG